MTTTAIAFIGTTTRGRRPSTIPRHPGHHRIRSKLHEIPASDRPFRSKRPFDATAQKCGRTTLHVRQREEVQAVLSAMSEHQCYEFLALDRPLTPKQMDELRAFSSRAEITPVRFWNECHWGDLKTNPAKLVERYFDAHLTSRTGGPTAWSCASRSSASKESACVLHGRRGACEGDRIRSAVRCETFSHVQNAMRASSTRSFRHPSAPRRVATRDNFAVQTPLEMSARPIPRSDDGHAASGRQARRRGRDPPAALVHPRCPFPKSHTSPPRQRRAHNHVAGHARTLLRDTCGTIAERSRFRPNPIPGATMMVREGELVRLRYVYEYVHTTLRGSFQKPSFELWLRMPTANV